MLPILVLLYCGALVSAVDEGVREVHTTKVFIIPIQPSNFNWSSEDIGAGNQFSYHPSLLDAPDLPSWMYYSFSKQHRSGFVYGVPPLKQKDLKLEIIAVNKRTYETRRSIIHLNVIEKTDPFINEIEVKIDNLNIEDMFERDRLSRLLDVFRLKLWPESAADLYITFMASAVHLGARLPLTPNEGEGVVLRLGSRSDFSTILYSLQEEVRPLKRKMDSCRDFKRTSVERILRKDGFALDWCYFNLNNDSLIKMNKHTGSIHNSVLLGSEWTSSVWDQPTKQEIPCRNYLSEFALTLIFPIVIMTTLVLLLSVILCFHHEGMVDDPSNEFFDSIFNICEELWRSKRNEDTPDVLMVQYEAVHRATHTLRSLSNQRNSDGTLKESPRLSSERTTGVRPSPPPYMGPKLSSRVDF